MVGALRHKAAQAEGRHDRLALFSPFLDLLRVPSTFDHDRDTVISGTEYDSPVVPLSLSPS